MGDKTGIGWTDATWNPVTGCSKVSPGCAHCYAETMTRRYAKTWGVPDLPWTPENAEQNVILHPERLDQPKRWRKPRMVFVNSMSDLFHELVPFEFIASVFNVMAHTPEHTYQILTKRPERMLEFFNGVAVCELGWRTHDGTNPKAAYDGSGGVINTDSNPWPLPNVWLGVSIENRQFVNRADVLRDTPAAVRFISAEPLLGPLVPRAKLPYKPQHPGEPDRYEWPGGEPGSTIGHLYDRGLDLTNIDWLIAGGESGPDHRPVAVEWVRDLRDETMRSDPEVAFFFKQWGGLTPKAGGRELDGRTWDEMPAVAHAN